MVIISTRADDNGSWVKAGQIFQRIALLANAEGVSVAVWAAPIQIGEYYRDVQETINTQLRPQMFFRLGYAGKDMGGHSPRLAASEVIRS